MLLDLAGGGMNPGPGWALSIRELEALGLTDNQAKRVAGVPPTFALDGWWVMLVDDEPFDPERARVIEIRGDLAICSKGARGTVFRTPKKALVRFAGIAGTDAECITISMAQSDDFLLGTAWYGRQLPEGDPGALLLLDEDDGVPDREPAPVAMAAWLYRQGTVEQILASIEARAAAVDPAEKIDQGVLVHDRARGSVSGD